MSLPATWTAMTMPTFQASTSSGSSKDNGAAVAGWCTAGAALLFIIAVVILVMKRNKALANGSQREAKMTACAHLERANNREQRAAVTLDLDDPRQQNLVEPCFWLPHEQPNKQVVSHRDLPTYSNRVNEKESVKTSSQLAMEKSLPLLHGCHCTSTRGCSCAKAAAAGNKTFDLPVTSHRTHNDAGMYPAASWTSIQSYLSNDSGVSSFVEKELSVTPGSWDDDPVLSCIAQPGLDLGLQSYTGADNQFVRAAIGCSIEGIKALVQQYEKHKAFGRPLEGNLMCTDSFAIGDFGQAGGCLSTKDESAKLTIPPGALAHQQTVYFGIIYETGESKEENFTPVYECGPSGLQFLKPVQLQVQHCVGVESDYRELCAFVDEGGETTDWKASSETTVVYSKTKATLGIMHFTGFKLGARNSTDEAGNASSYSFSSIPRPVSQQPRLIKDLYLCAFQCKGKVRLYFMNRDESLYNKICRREKQGGNEISSPQKLFSFYRTRGCLIVTAVRSFATERRFEVQDVMRNIYDYTEFENESKAYDITIRQESGNMESLIVAATCAIEPRATGQECSTRTAHHVTTPQCRLSLYAFKMEAGSSANNNHAVGQQILAPSLQLAEGQLAADESESAAAVHEQCQGYSEGDPAAASQALSKLPVEDCTCYSVHLRALHSECKSLNGQPKRILSKESGYGSYLSTSSMVLSEQPAVLHGPDTLEEFAGPSLSMTSNVNPETTNEISLSLQESFFTRSQPE